MRRWQFRGVCVCASAKFQTSGAMENRWASFRDRHVARFGVAREAGSATNSLGPSGGPRVEGQPRATANCVATADPETFDEESCVGARLC
eukprot:4607288-Alexandrium_andersonii.AAC.1